MAEFGTLKENLISPSIVKIAQNIKLSILFIASCNKIAFEKKKINKVSLIHQYDVCALQNCIEKQR